jgi:hypothetical protein
MESLTFFSLLASGGVRQYTNFNIHKPLLGVFFCVYKDLLEDEAIKNKINQVQWLSA